MAVEFGFRRSETNEKGQIDQMKIKKNKLLILLTIQWVSRRSKRFLAMWSQVKRALERDPMDSVCLERKTSLHDQLYSGPDASESPTCHANKAFNRKLPNHLIINYYGVLTRNARYLL